MKFPNAFDGIKKLFTAEILEIVSIVAGVIAGIAGAIAYGTDQTGHPEAVGAPAAIAAVVAIIAAILLIASAIISFLGINNASKDEPEFKNAVTAVIVTIVLSVISGFLPDSLKVVSALIDTVNTCLSVYISYTVVKGICNLAAQLNNAEMVERGNRVITYIIVAALLGAIADFVQTVWIKDPKANLNVILGAVILIFGLVKGVAYIIYLSKAKKMLQNA